MDPFADKTNHTPRTGKSTHGRTLLAKSRPRGRWRDWILVVFYFIFRVLLRSSRFHDNNKDLHIALCFPDLATVRNLQHHNSIIKQNYNNYSTKRRAGRGYPQRLKRPAKDMPEGGGSPPIPLL